MKVLVTGAAGYMGSILCKQLLDNGHEVRAFDNLLYGGSALLPLVGQKSFEFVRGDIRNTDQVRESLIGIQGVVHLAAIVGDPACARNPAEAVNINQKAAIGIIDEARAGGIKKMVFASTCSNYGKMRDISILATEDSELHPVSLYAETKVAVEKKLLEIDPASFSFTILRFATLYGISPRMRFDLTVNEFVKDLELHHKLVVFGEQFWRPYVHVSDAAHAINLVINASADLVAGQVFNVGDTNENYRKLDLVEIMQQRIKPVNVEYVHKTEDPRDYRVSFDKIKRQLGFNVSRRVKEGVDEIASTIEAGIIADFDNPNYYNTPIAK